MFPGGSKYQIGTLIVEYGIVYGIIYNIVPRGSKHPKYLRTLVPKAIKGMVFGARVLKDWVLGLSGFELVPSFKGC